MSIPGNWPISWNMARRELRGGLGGFRIFLACLTLGVAAIASVQSVSSSILQGLRNDGQGILGGDISIQVLYRGLTQEQLTYLEDTTEAVIHYVEMRTMARPQGDQSTLVELKGVDDHYPLFGQMQLRQNLPFGGLLARRNGGWGAVVEPSVLQRLGIKLGDSLRIGAATFEVRGIIEREPDRVGGGIQFGLGPRVMIALDATPETALLKAGSLVYHHYRLKLPSGTDIDTYLAALDKAFPHADWRVRDYRNASPRIERMVNRLTLFLTLVGLTALLVGGVGVSSAVKSYLDTKITTIATLKCLGATNTRVFQIYMIQVLVLAGVGILGGLLLGTAVPMLAATLLGDALPFNLVLGAHPVPLIIAALFGLLVTLTFSIWPLARVHQVPAAALFRSGVSPVAGWPRPRYLLAVILGGLALAGLVIGTSDNLRFALWFIIGAALTMLVFRLAAWMVLKLTGNLGRPGHPGLRLALANLQRPGAATANVVLSLGLGLTVLVAIMLIEGNLSRQVTESIPKQAPAFFFIDIQADQIVSFETDIGAIPGVENLRKVPYFRGRITAIKDQPPEQLLTSPDYEWMIRGDRGLSYAEQIPDNTTLVAGDWWSEDYGGPPLLSIHQDVSKGFGVNIGDPITLNVLGREIRAIVANIRELEWSSMQINFAIMFSPKPLSSAPHTYIATVSAAIAAEDRIRRQVTADFPNVTQVSVREALERVNEILGSIGAAVRSVAGVTLIAGTLVLAGAVAAGHRRRVYDSVVLKVLGATRRELLFAFLLEYGLLGILTGIIAAAIGSLTAWAVLTWIMKTGWEFQPGVVVITTLLCTATTLALGFVGTWRALGQKAAPLLRNE